mgnify:CR=1 FL=1
MAILTTADSVCKFVDGVMVCAKVHNGDHIGALLDLLGKTNGVKIILESGFGCVETLTAKGCDFATSVSELLSKVQYLF